MFQARRRRPCIRPPNLIRVRALVAVGAPRVDRRGPSGKSYRRMPRYDPPLPQSSSVVTTGDEWCSLFRADSGIAGICYKEDRFTHRRTSKGTPDWRTRLFRERPNRADQVCVLSKPRQKYSKKFQNYTTLVD